MSSAPFYFHAMRIRFNLFIPLTLFGLAVICLTGCGGNPTGPVQPANTMVTLVIAGTANDQLTEFDLAIQSLTLTSQSGNTINLLSAQQPTEFIHLNGGIEPLITASIPQDTYTSATATVGAADFSCITLVPTTGGLDTSTYAYGQTPMPNVTVNLPQPIKISGTSMGLSLNLLVAESATYPTCYSAGIQPYSITPTFSLTPVAFSSQPTNPENGKVGGLNGQVSSITAAGSSFAVSLPISESTRTVSVASSATTAYQGINSFSDLAVGTFVNLDGGIRSDGSLVATRIAVLDNAATSALSGPLLFVSDAQPSLVLWGRQEQGALFGDNDEIGGLYFSLSSAIFQISGQLSNVQTLPFLPSFTAATMVPGQNIYLSSQSVVQNGGFPYTPASTVTLVPQTVNGTVLGSSSEGAFTIYTVGLASYDLFPTLAVQAGQTTLLNNPGEVAVYVDNSVQQLNSQPLAAGSTLRFYGLVFNDNGVLRMDCAQVNDGVPENPPANPAAQSHLEKGQVTHLRTESLGPVPQTYRVIAPAP